jgi:hypothetical protein
LYRQRTDPFGLIRANKPPPSANLNGAARGLTLRRAGSVNANASFIFPPCDPTYADAVLDRLIHNAHRIDLNGESLRRNRKPSRKA